jgi:pentatricopeptide repeat protein
VYVYGFSVKSGLEADLLVSNSVLTMLVRGDQLEAARKLFDGMENKCDGIGLIASEVFAIITFPSGCYCWSTSSNTPIAKLSL